MARDLMFLTVIIGKSFYKHTAVLIELDRNNDGFEIAL